MVIDGKALPKSFPLEIAKLVVECLMKRAWKLRQLRLEFVVWYYKYVERDFLRLLTTCVSRALSELRLNVTGAVREIHEVISSFSDSLTALSVATREHCYCSTTDEWFLSFGTAIENCHKLETVDIKQRGGCGIKSADGLQRGLAALLGQEQLKTVHLSGLRINDADSSDLRVATAVAEALLSSPAKLHSLQLPSVQAKYFSGWFWELGRELSRGSGHPLGNLQDLLSNRLPISGDISPIFDICPNLKRLSFDVYGYKSSMFNNSSRFVKEFVVAYMQRYSNGNGEERKLSMEVEVLHSGFADWANLMIEAVTAEIACDVENFQEISPDCMEVRFRKRNAIMTVRSNF